MSLPEIAGLVERRLRELADGEAVEVKEWLEANLAGRVADAVSSSVGDAIQASAEASDVRERTAVRKVLMPLHVRLRQEALERRPAEDLDGSPWEAKERLVRLLIWADQVAGDYCDPRLDG